MRPNVWPYDQPEQKRPDAATLDGGSPTLKENDALDAARYRWLRKQHWESSRLCVVTNPKINVRLGTYCPSGKLLDQEIDTAIREGDK